MNLKDLFGEDRAVSPVIGVILMVAITVILAAVIGTFVLGLGDRVSQSTPSASFSFDYSNEQSGSANDTLDVSHNGGDTIDASALNATVSGAEGSSGGSTTFSGDLYDSGKVSAGTTDTLGPSDFSATFTASNTLVLDGASVDVVWSSSSGDSSAVLGSWSGPDA